jgi:hypothetical protein
MWRRVAVVGRRGALALVLALLGFVAARSRDLPGDSRADFAAPEVWPKAGEPNALRALTRAAALVAIPKDIDVDERLASACERGAKERPFVAAQLAANREAFLALERALRVSPTVFAGGSFHERSRELDEIFPLWSLSRLVQAEGCVSDSRRAPGALRHALSMLELAAKLRSAPHLEIVHLSMTLSMDGRALRAVEGVLGNAKLAPGQLEPLAARLESLRPTREEWERTWRGELAFAQRAYFESDWRVELVPDCDECAAVPRWLFVALPDGYSFQPRRTLARLDDDYRAIAHWRDHSCAENLAERQRQPPEPQSRARQIARALRPNGAGTFMIGNSAQTFARLDLAWCRAQARFTLTEVALALRLAEASHSRLPQSLAELAPELLPAPPADPWDGGALRYEPEQRRLRSSAPAGNDDLAGARLELRF